MNSSPRARSRAISRPLTSLKRRSQRSSGGLILLCALVYIVVGYIVTALPTFLWLWPLALVSILFHAVEITLPANRSRWSWGLQRSLRFLGTMALLIALAVSLNFLGSDQLNDITILGAAGQVLLFSLLAAFLVYVCRLLTQQLATRLLNRLARRPAQGVLVLVAGLGLAVGGGLALISQIS